MKLLALLFALALAIPLHAGVSVTTPVYALLESTGTGNYGPTMATFTLPPDVGAGDDGQPFDEGYLLFNGVWYNTGYEVAVIDFNALYAEGY